MARDLIPPPSPAGRPDIEGTATHRFVELPPEPVAARPAPPLKQPKLALPPTQYRNRFGFLAGALGGVVLASAALLVAVFAWNGGGGDDAGMHPNWSAWQPADETTPEGATEIAQHVGVQYKYPDGNQLLGVKASSGDANITLHANLISDLSGETVVYQMQGSEEGGAMRGDASNARGAVVFREALELALYSFRYLPDAEGVMVLIPPPPTTPAEAIAIKEAMAKAATDPKAAEAVNLAAKKEQLKYRALFFRPGDLKAELEVPLGVTVPAGAPNADTITEAEAEAIAQRVRSNLFLWQQDVQTGAFKLEPMPSTP